MSWLDFYFCGVVATLIFFWWTRPRDPGPVPLRSRFALAILEVGFAWMWPLFWIAHGIGELLGRRSRGR